MLPRPTHIPSSFTVLQQEELTSHSQLLRAFFCRTEIILLAHYAFAGNAGEFSPPASVALNQWLVALNILASHSSLFLVMLGPHGWEGFLKLQGAGAALHCGAQASHRTGFSRRRAQTLECAGFRTVAHGLLCPVACGIFSDQGLNLCPLPWQVNS